MLTKNNLNSDFYQIAKSLEWCYPIFYRMWELSIPRFSDSVPTAAVIFNKQGKHLEVVINEDFWLSLNFMQKQFVILHEFLHILLNHGVRYQRLNPKVPQIFNIAADIVVNDMLIGPFLFSKQELNFPMQLIWRDEICPNLSKNREFEYYYNELLKSSDVTNVSFDDHSSLLEGMSDKDFDKLVEDILKNASDEDIKEFSEKLGGGIKAGDGAPFDIASRKILKGRTKKSWHSIVNLWTNYGERPDVDWRSSDRRYAILKGSDIILPTYKEVDARNKVNLWFYQDTSGSCQDYVDRFFSGALTFPKKFFDIKMFGFTTSVYPLNPSKPQFQSGGTAFNIIEDHIQKHCNGRYPDAVFVFTDGEGNTVVPKHPERWNWFLEGSHQSTSFIDKRSKIYQLSEFLE